MRISKRLDESAGISILGSGMVGSTVGKGLAKFGNEITFYDNDCERVKEFCSQGYKATRDSSCRQEPYCFLYLRSNTYSSI